MKSVPPPTHAHATVNTPRSSATSNVPEPTLLDRGAAACRAGHYGRAFDDFEKLALQTPDRIPQALQVTERLNHWRLAERCLAMVAVRSLTPLEQRRRLAFDAAFLMAARHHAPDVRLWTAVALDSPTSPAMFFAPQTRTVPWKQAIAQVRRAPMSARGCIESLRVGLLPVPLGTPMPPAIVHADRAVLGDVGSHCVVREAARLGFLTHWLGDAVAPLHALKESVRREALVSAVIGMQVPSARHLLRAGVGDMPWRRLAEFVIATQRHEAVLMLTTLLKGGMPVQDGALALGMYPSDVRFLRALLDHGLDANWEHPDSHQTFLERAVDAVDKKSVTLLRAHGAKCRDEATVLMLQSFRLREAEPSTPTGVVVTPLDDTPPREAEPSTPTGIVVVPLDDTPPREAEPSDDT